MLHCLVGYLYVSTKRVSITADRCIDGGPANGIEDCAAELSNCCRRQEIADRRRTWRKSGCLQHLKNRRVRILLSSNSEAAKWFMSLLVGALSKAVKSNWKSHLVNTFLTVKGDVVCGTDIIHFCHSNKLVEGEYVHDGSWANSVLYATKPRFLSHASLIPKQWK